MKKKYMLRKRLGLVLTEGDHDLEGYHGFVVEIIHSENKRYLLQNHNNALNHDNGLQWEEASLPQKRFSLASITWFNFRFPASKSSPKTRISAPCEAEHFFFGEKVLVIHNAITLSY